MTNTNDFRKYSYSSDTSYMFDTFSRTRASEAPKLEPKEEHRLRLRGEGALKSKLQLHSEQKSALKKAAVVIGVAVVALLMVAIALHSFALKNELTREIQKTQTQIANAHSEYISLQSQLDSLVSIRTIDKYAVEELKMTKVKSNQIKYIDVDEFKEAREKELAQKNIKNESNKKNN